MKLTDLLSRKIEKEVHFFAKNQTAFTRDNLKAVTEGISLKQEFNGIYHKKKFFTVAGLLFVMYMLLCSVSVDGTTGVAEALILAVTGITYAKRKGNRWYLLSVVAAAVVAGKSCIAFLYPENGAVYGMYCRIAVMAVMGVFGCCSIVKMILSLCRYRNDSLSKMIGIVAINALVVFACCIGGVY